MSRKILLYGDLDLNIVDGSSIWLVNLAKLLLTDKENYVDILLKKRIRNSVLAGELEKRYRIKLLYAKEYMDHITEVDEKNIETVLSAIDRLRDYSCMIVRGIKVMEALGKSVLMDKIIPYLTDFCQDRDKISKEQKIFLGNLYERSRAYFVQTEAMKAYMRDILNVDGEKMYVLYPVVFPGRNMEKEEKTLVYAGKIARDWNVLELIEIMKKLEERDPSIRLHFVGSKINRDSLECKDEILEGLKNMPNIMFHGSVPHNEAERVMRKCFLGYAFRSSSVDHDQALEVSVKLLEYCFAEVPMVLRRTKIHEKLLGKEYPLFVESVEQCTEKIIEAFRKPQIMERAYESLAEVRESFAPDRLYNNIKPALEKYPQKEMRLLVSGHDLKFFSPLLPYFQKEYTVEVQKLNEYMDFSAREAKEKIKNADIIWCEWMLSSAQWYSRHCYPHQSVFIRAHRFEVMRKYGQQLELKKISKIITVSYYWMEEFVRKFKIPFEKCTVINNFIEVDRYPNRKEKDAKYHLALVGALPKRKGLDRAVELLKLLKKKDPRYCLHVPGKRPEEFPNTWNVPEERAYYESVYRKIQKEKLTDAVFFDGWVDMTEFLPQTGYVLSLSDARFPESFHVTPFESIAAGGVALALRWEGIEYIYPEEAVFDSIEEIAGCIERLNEQKEEYEALADRELQFLKTRYDLPIIWESILRLLKTGGDYEEMDYKNCETTPDIVSGSKKDLSYDEPGKSDGIQK